MVDGIYDYDGSPRVSFDGHIVYEEDIGKPSYDIGRVSPADEMDITISGGSMGGLFTAYGLQQAGHSVDIYEKTAPGKMRSRGAGIVMQPELLEFMEGNDLADRDEVVLTVDGLQYLDDDGDVLSELDHTFYLTSWDTTYRSLRKRLPDASYNMGKKVVDVTQDADAVTVQFEDGETRRSDFHVVAEGYRSPTRQQLMPDVDVEYAGYVAWRGIKPADEFPEDIREQFTDKFVYYHGPDLQINGYPVPSPEGPADENLRINLVWYSKVPEEKLDDVLRDTTGRRREGSVPPGFVREEVLEEQTERARNEVPELFTRLFTSYDEPYIQAIYDISTPKMLHDRVAIIGDAAFFIRPHMAAGTAYAAASGLTLAEALSSDDVDSALEQWDQAGRKLGKRLVGRAEERGQRYMQL